jgi:hypothetical protein
VAFMYRCMTVIIYRLPPTNIDHGDNQLSAQDHA